MNRKNIIVELTPLLDVILIILFFVLLQGQLRVDSIYVETRESLAATIAEHEAILETEIEALRLEFGSELEILRQRSDEFDLLQLGLEDNTQAVFISLNTNRLNRNIRHLLIESEHLTETIPLTWDVVQRDAALFRLAEVVADAVRDASASFIVFRFDSTGTFADDYNLVRLVIRNQQLHGTRVFSVVLDINN